MTLTTNQRTELDITNAWIEYAKAIDDQEVLQYHLKQKAALLDRIKGSASTTVIEQPSDKQVKTKKPLTKNVIGALAFEFSQMSLQDILQHKHKTLLLSLANIICFILDNPGCTNNDIYGSLGISYTRANEYLLYLTRGRFPIKRVSVKLPKKGIYGAHNGLTYYCDASRIMWYEDYTRFVSATK
jgi:hypothetical protein